MSVALNRDNFVEQVNSKDLSFVYFWAEWCPPCKKLGPVYESLAAKYPDVLFGKVNAEIEPEMIAHFGIRGIPTIIAVKDSVVVFAHTGFLPESVLEEVVSSNR
jgi:thioredoxin 1